MMSAVERACRQALRGEGLSREEALAVLECGAEELREVLEAAFALRKRSRGLCVEVQILSNAKSGNCSQNCAYCAQSARADAGIETWPLIEWERLAETGEVAARGGLARHCIGLSGIRQSDEDIGAFAAYVRRLKERSSTPICCSIGFLSEAQARTLKEAGVDRINHNLNTSRAFYPRICTTHTFDERVANIRMLQGLGFEICCGGIVGMGESDADVVDMFLTLRELAPDSVPVNFLLPLKGTPLEGADTSRLSADYCLAVMALARLLLPDTSIRCAAGREVYFQGRERELFMAADSIFASGYLTAGGQGIADTIRLIEEAGFVYAAE